MTLTERMRLYPLVMYIWTGTEPYRPLWSWANEQPTDDMLVVGAPYWFYAGAPTQFVGLPLTVGWNLYPWPGWVPDAPVFAGVPHHWVQGPQDVWPVAKLNGRRGWAFRYWIEAPDSIPNTTVEEAEQRIDYILNRWEKCWGRADVEFIQVREKRDAEIVLRFAKKLPPPWDAPEGSGWYYYDAVIGKAVAQVHPVHFADLPSLAYVMGMEMCGHGAFRMYDMYLPVHEPYPIGNMGGWAAAMANGGGPTDIEIEDAKLWLLGKAPEVHTH